MSSCSWDGYIHELLACNQSMRFIKQTSPLLWKKRIPNPLSDRDILDVQASNDAIIIVKTQILNYFEKTDFLFRMDGTGVNMNKNIVSLKELNPG